MRKFVKTALLAICLSHGSLTMAAGMPVFSFLFFGFSMRYTSRLSRLLWTCLLH